MNGNIEVNSELGKGTRFPVTIPHKIVPEGEIIVKPERQEPAEMTLKDVRILLAEDNALNAEIAMTLLEDAGATVELDTDGEKAVSMLQESSIGYYDLILMDVQMPHMNGYDATQYIRALPDKHSEIPIIAMTANAFEEDKKRAFNSGMNGYITKPIKIEELIFSIGKLLEF